MVVFTLPYPNRKSEKSAFCRRYGLNSIYAGKHWAKRNEDKRYWHMLVLSELQKQKIPQKYFEKPVTITFYWNDGLDCSNHAYMGKMIEDSLKGYLLHEDNRRFVTEVCHRFHNEDYIQVEITAGGEDE